MNTKSISAVLYGLIYLLGAGCVFYLPTFTKSITADARPVLFSQGDVIRGRVVGVMDGDTLRILMQDRQELRIRLAEIDAPEKSQAFGDASKRSLSDLAYNKPADIHVMDTDRSGLIVGRVFIGSLDTSMAQVGRGMAWANAKQLTDDRVSKLQFAARQKLIGLWADEQQPTPPWVFRGE